MNMCANHPETPAVAYCRACGKPLCELCRGESLGVIYCAEHFPAAQTAGSGAPSSAPPYAGSPYASAASSPYASTASSGYTSTASSAYTPPASSPYSAHPGSDASPALALILGMIPGVGAIYNGQYAKGLVHAIVMGLLITVIANGTQATEILVSFMLAAWWFYMVLEAYHTARKRREGLPVDEFSSILDLRGTRSGFPILAVVLIALGVLLLLDTTGLVSMERLVRYWPLALILMGVYMLYARTERRAHDAGITRELSDERR